jgi:hypothetical protein
MKSLRVSAHWSRIHTKVSCLNMHGYVRTIPTLVILLTGQSCVYARIDKTSDHDPNLLGFYQTVRTSSKQIVTSRSYRSLIKTVIYIKIKRFT